MITTVKTNCFTNLILILLMMSWRIPGIIIKIYNVKLEKYINIKLKQI